MRVLVHQMKCCAPSGMGPWRSHKLCRLRERDQVSASACERAVLLPAFREVSRLAPNAYNDPAAQLHPTNTFLSPTFFFTFFFHSSPQNNMFSFKHASILAVIAAGVGLVSSQTLTSQCQATLTQIVLSSNAQCLNGQALVAVVTAGSSTSLVGPINNWLTGLCAQPACTNDTLSTIVSNVTSNCPTELSSLGLGNATASEITSVVEQAYPTVRKVLCLADTSSNNTLCVTELLTNLQNSVGTLTSTNIESLVNQINQGNLPNVSSTVLCTDCDKEAYNIIKNDYPDLVSTQVVSEVSTECGATFVDGADPSAVSQSANPSTASPVSAVGSNDALPNFGAVGGIIASSVLAVLTGFTFIA